MQALFLYKHTEKPSRDGIGSPKLALTFDDGAPEAYEDLMPLLRPKLLAQKTVEQIVDSCCLVEDSFEGNEDYSVKDAEYRDFGLVYTFLVDGDEIEVRFEIETIEVL